MNHLPDWLAGEPWVRWPPWSSAMPMKVSPGLQQRHEHRLVGLRAGVRLDVGERAVEQLAGALDGQLLGLVDLLAAAVVAPAGIALGVFVGEHRALPPPARRARRCSPRRSARSARCWRCSSPFSTASIAGSASARLCGEHRQRRCRASWRRPDSCHFDTLGKLGDAAGMAAAFECGVRGRLSAPRAPPRLRSAAGRTPRRWRRCARATAGPRWRRAPARPAPWGCGWPRSRCRCRCRRPARRGSALPDGDRLAHGLAEVRIVDRCRRIGAKIEHRVTCLLQVALENFLQVEAGMIRRDRDGGPRHLDDRSPLAVESFGYHIRGRGVTVPQNRGKLATRR